MSQSPSSVSRCTRCLVLTFALSILVSACGASAREPIGPGALPQDTTTKLPTRAAQWALEWGDEFDGPTINPQLWIVNNGAANVNNELEYYTPSDVYIENGALVLKSEQRSLGGRLYTSGEVRTGRLRTVTPGYAVEWRTQVPSGKGIWPANWLVAPACDGLNGCGSNWPPEIDVLEMKGSAPNINVMTHWWGSYPTQGYESSTYTAPTNLDDGYHTYRLEWFPDSIVWYVDAVQRAKHTANITVGQMQLVMNTAVGGGFDGQPSSATVFPQYHRIDYVRVYKDTANKY